MNQQLLHIFQWFPPFFLLPLCYNPFLAKPLSSLWQTTVARHSNLSAFYKIPNAECLKWRYDLNLSSVLLGSVLTHYSPPPPLFFLLPGSIFWSSLAYPYSNARPAKCIFVNLIMGLLQVLYYMLNGAVAAVMVILYYLKINNAFYYMKLTSLFLLWRLSLRTAASPPPPFPICCRISLSLSLPAHAPSNVLEAPFYPFREPPLPANVLKHFLFL